MLPASMQESTLWADCLNCESKVCCTHKSIYPLFLTPDESVNLTKTWPCKSLANGKCTIYENRPVDCKLFPFDLHVINGKIFWIIWKFRDTKNKQNKEAYLKFFEKKYSTFLKTYGKKYALDFREKLKSEFGYEVLRELKA